MLAPVDPFFEAFAVDARAQDDTPVRLIIDEEASYREDSRQRLESVRRVVAHARTSDLNHLTQESTVTIGGETYRIVLIEADEHGITPLTLQRW